MNHLGHFLLTNLLLARLRAQRAGAHRHRRLRRARSEDAHRHAEAAVTDFATLAATGGPRRGEFNGRLAYVNSKLCNLWFAYELDRRLAAAGLSNGAQRLSVNGFDPGLVPGSGLARDYPRALRFVWDRILPGLARVLTRVLPTINPAPKAGAALAHLVLDPELAGVSGKYFPSHSRWREAPSSDASYDAGRAGELWEASVRMTGLTRERIAARADDLNGALRAPGGRDARLHRQQEGGLLRWRRASRPPGLRRRPSDHNRGARGGTKRNVAPLLILARPTAAGSSAPARRSGRSRPTTRRARRDFRILRQRARGFTVRTIASSARVRAVAARRAAQTMNTRRPR